MKENSGWRYFFNEHAPKYMNESYVKDTIKEVDFIEEELKLHKEYSILDIGCGTGRHSVELAKRGYKMTGLDISESMLKEAQKKADEENVSIELIHADATEFRLDKKFDACICLCEGAFGLLSMDEDPFERDLKILYNINSALKLGGAFLLTALNGLRTIRMYNESDIDEGKYDPLSLTEIYPITNLIESAPKDIKVKEKGFTGTELTLLMKISGFKVKNIWGGTAGRWNRERVKLDEMELMVVSKKIRELKEVATKNFI